MSIIRINELPEGSGSLSSDDVFLFMDDPSGNGVTKKISLSEISSAIGGGGSGGTVFEIGNIDLHNGGIQNAQILQFNNNSYQSVITGPTPAASGNTAQRLIIQGQRAQGNGEGGDVYLWGGDADTNGGDIKIYAGDADNVSPNNGYGGYVNIDGGRGVTSGGDVEITAGYSEGGQAGDVSIVGGPTSSGVAGNVNIKTNNETNNWTFSPSGSFTLPNGNLIQSQAGQGETNIQIIDNESPFKIYTHASAGAKAWIYDASGNLSIPGSISLPNNSTIASGTYDNNMSGNGGISLSCVAGYQLNWQASHLKNTLIGDVTNAPQTIYFDSPLQFPGSSLSYMTIDASGITFPDGTTQLTSTALPDGTTIGNILQWDGVEWVSAPDISPTNLTINGRYTEKITSASISANTLTIDLNLSNLFTCNLNNNINTINISNIPATSGMSIGFTLIFTADGTARSVNWPSSIKWESSLPPTLTITNNKQDVFSFITTNNGTSWLGFVGGQNY